jgi:hypothetical protein
MALRNVGILPHRYTGSEPRKQRLKNTNFCQRHVSRLTLNKCVYVLEVSNLKLLAHFCLLRYLK